MTNTQENKKAVVLAEREVFDHTFTVYGTPEEPLFLAKDVAEMIDYAKTGKGAYDVNKMLKTVDEDEKLIRTLFLSGQNRDVAFITEDGLYEVLMQSRKPIAKQFKKQVKEILKSIRKDGMYMTQEVARETLDNPVSFLARAVVVADKEIKKLQEKIVQQTPKVDYYEQFMNSTGTINFTD